MRIRTQDRTSSVDIDGMIINIVTDPQEVETQCAIVADKLETINMKLLGIYSTEEKALKVIDMIEDAYEDANMLYVSNTVFHMPADEEVIV